MGGFATHAIFGKEVLEENFDVMPALVIQKHPGVFGVGCQGPDLFLYNIPMLLSNHEKNLGIRMHHEESSRYFAYLMQTILESSSVWKIEIGLSYLYGALAHYTLDSMIHPYVYARIGFDASTPYSKKATMGLHHRLESAIDAKMIALKEDMLPSDYHAAKSQKMTRREKETLAEFLAKAVSKSYRIRLKKENVTASFRMMKIITSGFFVASDHQREKLQKMEWPFCEDYGLSNFMVTDNLIKKRRVMNTQNCVWHNPWDKRIESTDSVWEIYDKAVNQYREYCILMKEAFPLYRDNFFAIIGKNTDWEEIRKKIYHAAKGLGNRSYETGLPL